MQLIRGLHTAAHIVPFLPRIATTACLTRTITTKTGTSRTINHLAQLQTQIQTRPHSTSNQPFHTMSATATANNTPSTTNTDDIWNPKQYLLFDDMRARPGLDLIQRVVSHTLPQCQQSIDSIRRVVDLGCGTGKLALQLAERFPSAQVTGVDSSANMLEQAKIATQKQSSQIQSRVNWKQAEFEQFKDPGVDLIYSNAALHWNHNHAQLFPHLMSQLRSPGGILAVQMPNNFRAPSHLCMLEALKEGKFFSDIELEKLWQNQPNVHLDGQSYYYHLLAPHARILDLWQTEYLQPISSTTAYHPVLEWTKSTALAPILAALKTDTDKTRFQQIYSRLLEKEYPYFEGKAGRQVLFPFKRIFMIATK